MTDTDIQNIQGLSATEVEAQRQAFGSNELPMAQRRTPFRLALEVLREPMFLLLVACGTLYFLLGDIHEGILLLSFVFVVMGITVYQENKTERTIEALRDMASPRALVIRDGQQHRVAGREVVVDDWILLREGDRVPADATVVWTLNLTVDESLLTGESVPVLKKEEALVYSGTVVIQGQGLAKITAVGVQTEIGKIGKALKTISIEDSPLQKETAQLVRILSLAGAFFCATVVVVYGIIHHQWLEGFLAGLTLAMAILPEEFPVVLTIFLALGAWRLSQQRVLARRVRAVEALGTTTVLCTDKTGTLTQNTMAIQQLFTVTGHDFQKGHFYTVDTNTPILPESFHSLVEYGILASKRDPFDPMEKALLNLGTTLLSNTEHLHSAWKMVKEYPLSSQFLSLSQVWESPQHKGYTIAAKGSPEAIADLCHLSEVQTQQLETAVRKMASDGLRVLGIARATFSSVSLPQDQHDFQFEYQGLVGMSDPIRPMVPAAIQDCHTAGIRVMMITGDYPETALHIARKIGLPTNAKVLTGAEMDCCSDAELAILLQTTSIFARVRPEHKLRIVEGLKTQGQIVAMTGDGVNDAPALKAAHIGIAMGERGTDVAREASALVVLDDDFSSIVAGIRMGRRIVDNLRKAMTYILAVHVPIVGLSMIPVLFGWPLILFPVHIVFLELIIDPACSLVFEGEPEEPSLMQRPPRSAEDRLFSFQRMGFGLLQGLLILGLTLSAYKIAIHLGDSLAHARALTFSALVILNLILILANRSLEKSLWATLRNANLPFFGVSIAALGFLALALYVPYLNRLFSFAPLGGIDGLIVLGMAILTGGILRLFRAR